MWWSSQTKKWRKLSKRDNKNWWLRLQAKTCEKLFTRKRECIKSFHAKWGTMLAESWIFRMGRKSGFFEVQLCKKKNPREERESMISKGASRGSGPLILRFQEILAFDFPWTSDDPRHFPGTPFVCGGHTTESCANWRNAASRLSRTVRASLAAYQSGLHRTELLRNSIDPQSDALKSNKLQKTHRISDRFSFPGYHEIRGMAECFLQLVALVFQTYQTPLCRTGKTYKKKLSCIGNT